jgi:hypothetical protein
MRYSNPIILLKYLRYYWVAANSKGHGVHSPFVFKFIQEHLNASISLEANAVESSSTKMLMQSIEATTINTMPNKIKKLIVRLLEKFKPVNSSVIVGLTLPIECIQLKEVDFVFIGTGISPLDFHQQTDLVLEKLHPDSWMIMEGIHASSEMEVAWEMLKKHPKVRLSIDLFFIGLLFCRKEQKEQEHFIIRY